MKIGPTPLAFPAIHPAWAPALNAQNAPVAVKPVQAGSEPQNPGENAGLALSLTLEDLQNQDRLTERLKTVAGSRINSDRAATIGMQICTEVGTGLNDLVRLQHPDWQSGMDLPIGGLAIAASSLEMWRALESESTAEKLFSAARLGANVIDLVAGSMESLAQAAPTLHGICLLVRTAAGFGKICIPTTGENPVLKRYGGM